MNHLDGPNIIQDIVARTKVAAKSPRATHWSGNPYCREMICTSDHLVLTSSDRLLLILQTFLLFKQSRLA